MIDARIAAHFRQAMQRRMPDGWKIAVNFERLGEHHQLTGYYDRASFGTGRDMGSEEPSDPAKTLRILTIMLASEY